MRSIQQRLSIYKAPLVCIIYQLNNIKSDDPEILHYCNQSDLVICDGHCILGGFLVHHISGYLGIHSKLQTYGNEEEFDSV
jgi:hypothetical protein